MASGSAWQQYYCPTGQGKFSSSAATSMSFQTGITMEYTQDLHLKMSKKIAQLTKVKAELNGASGCRVTTGGRRLHM
ncbi:Protein FAM184A [Liparis tanakae]|uniref:Protein FAM184A n=1 Tax=Liparis tanakae TaxID=230148 RepID=A0A4Z2HUB3_9TELE|nr:Protein FAM184A [Liparis tanakae]